MNKFRLVPVALAGVLLVIVVGLGYRSHSSSPGFAIRYEKRVGGKVVETIDRKVGANGDFEEIRQAPNAQPSRVVATQRAGARLVRSDQLTYLGKVKPVLFTEAELRRDKNFVRMERLLGYEVGVLKICASENECAYAYHAPALKGHLLRFTAGDTDIVAISVTTGEPDLRIPNLPLNQTMMETKPWRKQ